MNDAFAGADVSSYDADLNRGLSLTGENKDFFAQGRLAVLARHLAARGGGAPRRVLDYGCAAGETTRMLAERWPAARIVGVDTSPSLIDEARGNIREDRCSFQLLADLPADRTFDLVYCNGVFHHIPPAERAAALAWIGAHLAPGGFFGLWENNSWNPGTRLVMSRVPFDRDAVLLSPAHARHMLRQAGFRVVAREFSFFFPRFLRVLRPLERWLRSVPLGAQYLLLAQR